MTSAATRAGTEPVADGDGWRRLFRDRPIIPLLVLLGVLVVV